jgi:hypothetical protein
LRVYRPQDWRSNRGYADYFDKRRKGIFLQIAELKPSDVLFDLGCGDASFLIYAVQKCKVKKAIGFEDDKNRIRKARLKIHEAGLDELIFVNPNNFYDEELSEASVIFHMLPEDSYDVKYFQSQKANIKRGTRLIKHDLPLVGYIPTKIELPFYSMTFPLKKARSKNQWASIVLGERNARPCDVWYELLYYQSAKTYYKQDIDRFASLLNSRLRR